MIGNLTRDPELSTSGNGISYCKFGVAVPRNFSKEKEVDFFNVTVWRGQAENCAKYLSKGKKVSISGSIQINNFEKDGVKRQSIDVVAEEVEFLSPKYEDITVETKDDGALPF